jgi:RND superfamily putative drug exporter
MASVGSAVAFAGGTVVLAMLALLLIGVGFLASIGLSVAFIVVIAVAAALTLLPALLTLLGNRIDRGHLRLPGRAVSRPRRSRTRPGGASPTGSPAARGPG